MGELTTMVNLAACLFARWATSFRSLVFGVTTGDSRAMESFPRSPSVAKGATCRISRAIGHLLLPGQQRKANKTRHTFMRKLPREDSRERQATAEVPAGDLFARHSVLGNQSAGLLLACVLLRVQRNAAMQNE